MRKTPVAVPTAHTKIDERNNNRPLRSPCYRLENGVPVHEPDPRKWWQWVINAGIKRRVAITRIGDKALVCTFLVYDGRSETFFVGLDLNLGNDEPKLYMTDVYGSELVNGRHYGTYEEALNGHWEIVTGVEAEHGIENRFARLFPQPGDPGLPTWIWRGISAPIDRDFQRAFGEVGPFLRGRGTMLKAVPTAPKIQTTPATQHQRYDVAASFKCQMDTPQIQCEVTSDLTQVRFRCGYCNCHHYHGNVPKHSPLAEGVVHASHAKGHRVAHCHIDPNPYPNGYYLRTDLDKVTSERFPNVAVVGNRDIGASNAHFQKCEHLSMPFCIVKRRRNYACFDVDFITTDSLGMDAVIGKALREFRVLYRASHPTRRLNRKR